MSQVEIRTAFIRAKATRAYPWGKGPLPFATIPLALKHEGKWKYYLMEMAERPSLRENGGNVVLCRPELISDLSLTGFAIGKNYGFTSTLELSGKILIPCYDAASMKDLYRLCLIAASTDPLADPDFGVLMNAATRFRARGNQRMRKVRQTCRRIEATLQLIAEGAFSRTGSSIFLKRTLPHARSCPHCSVSAAFIEAIEEYGPKPKKSRVI